MTAAFPSRLSAILAGIPTRELVRRQRAAAATVSAYQAAHSCLCVRLNSLVGRYAPDLCLQADRHPAGMCFAVGIALLLDRARPLGTSGLILSTFTWFRIGEFADRIRGEGELELALQEVEAAVQQVTDPCTWLRGQLIEPFAKHVAHARSILAGIQEALVAQLEQRTSRRASGHDKKQPASPNRAARST